MPVLLQGLDALSRHVDKLASGKSDASSARKQKFNPLTWLAQYLLRNHPTHSSDHRDELCGVALTKTFKIFKAEDIEALTPLSAELQGKLIKNSSVPYKFSFVVGRPAKSFTTCVRVTLFKEKSAALARIRDTMVNDVPLTDCDETPAFTSFTPAGDLVQYVQEDLAKKLSVTGFKSEQGLANPTITNCIAFAIRGGMLLAGHDKAENFVKTCVEVERGRRNLLRRLPEFETTWQLFTHGDGLSTSQIEQVFQQLDTLWNMDGQFIRSLPANFAARIPCADPNKVTFNEFWTFFEALVCFSFEVFENAEKRRQMAEQEAQDALERQRQREANIAEEERQQRLLKAQFETLCADAYLNPELNQIMIKGAVLAYPMDLKGEHIVLILQLLRAWGHSLMDTEGKYMEQDEWDEHTKELWIGWRKLHGPQTNYPGVVDAESLKVLTDKEAFQAFHHIEE
ncbi:unnamed protein product [Cladocopium goreaui]|uniref:8-oxoguanine deaminase n=1 Tax=Cladocopium goreaui TaxID=2562237 RepID=A0A9P1BJC8_9DINO|nr:unnamed protein product [Cladocopium goreaui]